MDKYNLVLKILRICFWVCVTWLVIAVTFYLKDRQNITKVCYEVPEGHSIDVSVSPSASFEPAVDYVVGGDIEKESEK